MFEDEEALEGGEGASEAGGSRSRGAVVAHAQHPAHPGPAQVFHPPAYRGVVAGWPQDWRERWGRRANELEEAGLSWRDAEAQAFVETWNLVRQGPRTGTIATAGADPERN
jgi:hypothetical protein